MASNEVSIKLTVDKREGETNLAAFQRAFNKLLSDLGKTPEEAKAFYQLTQWIDDGTVKTESLDSATQKLVAAYRQGKQVAADADFLGLKRLDDAEREVNEIRAAFERLKASGKLSGQEVAVAALKAEEAIAKVRKETTGWVEALNQVKGSLAGVVTASAGLTAVTQQAIQFEDRMADVAKVVEGDRSQIDALGEALKNMTYEIPLSADALAQLAAAGGQLGIPLGDLEQFTRLAAKMTVAFQMSAEDSGAAIAKMANVFGLTLTGVEELGDAVNVLGNTMATNETDIIEVLTRIGATATNFGLAGEQAAALAATVLSLGAHANVAATGINGLLNKLQTASVLGDEAQEALYRLGFTGEQLARSIRDNPQQALLEFLGTLKALDKQSRAEILTKIFGLEYQDDVAKMVLALDQYTSALGRATDKTQTAGAINREFGTRMETTGAQLQLLKNSVESLAITLGSMILPVLNPIVKGFADATQGLNEFARTFPLITGMAGALVTAATVAGSLRVAYLAMGLVGAKVGAEMASAFKNLKVPMGDALASVGKLGTAFNLLGAALTGWEIGSYFYEQFDGVRQVAFTVIEGILAIVSEAQLQWDKLKAAFTDDTVEAALERWKQRSRETYETFENLRKKSRETAQEQESGANRAAAALDKQGAAAQKAGEKTTKANEEAAAAAALAREETERLQKAMDLLGIDANKFGAGISKAENEIVTAFKRISQSAQGFGTLVVEGVAGATKKLSADALPELEFALYDAFDKGRVSAQQLDTGLGLIRARARELSAEFETARRATEALGLDASVAFGGMSAQAQKAVDAFRQLVSVGQVTKANFEQIFSAALRMADGTQSVEALRSMIEQLNKQGVLVGPIFDKAMTQLRAKLDEVTPGINSADEAMQRLGLQSQSALKQTVATLAEAYDALKKFGAPIEDQRAAWLKLAEAQIAANRGVADWGLKAQASALGLNNQLADLVGKSDRSKAATEALAITFREEADAAKRNTEAIRERGTALVAAAQQALETAKVQGDALEIEQATVQVRQAEAQAARELADAMAAEAASARANAQAMREKADADGLVTDAERKLIAETTAAADALTKQAAAAEKAADKAAAASKAATEKKDEIRTATIDWAALAAQHGVAAGKAGELAAAQAKVWAGMQKMYSTGFGGMDGYIDAMNAATARAAGFVQAMGRVEEAAAGGDEALGEYIRALRGAINMGSIMGREEMAPLRAALRDAQQRMRDLGDSARDTLNGLRDELDGMNKNYDEIERRRADARRAEIEAQLAIAKSAGNTQAVADLTSALRLLRQVSTARIQEAKAREQEDARLLKDGGGTIGPLTTGQTQDRTVVKVVDINIKVGDQTGTAQVVEGGEEVIVDMLRKAQMVAS